jgi:hypothetical protein
VATGTCAAFVVASPPELGREMRAGGSAAGQFDAAKGVRADESEERHWHVRIVR